MRGFSKGAGPESNSYGHSYECGDAHAHDYIDHLAYLHGDSGGYAVAHTNRNGRGDGYACGHADPHPFANTDSAADAHTHAYHIS